MRIWMVSQHSATLINEQKLDAHQAFSIPICYTNQVDIFDELIEPIVFEQGGVVQCLNRNQRVETLNVRFCGVHSLQNEVVSKNIPRGEPVRRASS